VPCATLGVSVQVPNPTNVTVSPLLATLHTFGVLEVTVGVPSPVVPTLAVKPKNSFAGEGMFVMVGVVALARPIVKDCVVPEPAR
jgi:hypothetical protein